MPRVPDYSAQPPVTSSRPVTTLNLIRDEQGNAYYSPDGGKTHYLFDQNSNTYRQDVIYRKDLQHAYHYVPSLKGWYEYDVAKNQYFPNREINEWQRYQAVVAKRREGFPKQSPFKEHLACANAISKIPGYSEVETDFIIPTGARYEDGDAMYLMTVSPAGETVLAHENQVGFLTPAQGEQSALRNGENSFEYVAKTPDGKGVKLQWNAKLNLKPADAEIAKQLGVVGSLSNFVEGRPLAPTTKTTFKLRLERSEWVRPAARFLSAFGSTVSKLAKWAKGDKTRSEAVLSKVTDAQRACQNVPGASDAQTWSVPYVNSEGKLVQGPFYAALVDLKKQVQDEAQRANPAVKPEALAQESEVKDMQGEVEDLRELLKSAGAGR